MGACILYHRVRDKFQSFKATLMMIVCQLFVAGFSVAYKLAGNDGMNLSVLIVYRYLFCSILVLPFALIIERNKRPKLTWKILFQAFLCAVFGGPMAQNMFAKSLVLTSATFTAAFTNLIPPLTFIVAAMFGYRAILIPPIILASVMKPNQVILLGALTTIRSEKVGLRTNTGKAKVIGTLVAVGGAMFLTLYKGQALDLVSTHINILHGPRIDGRATTTHITLAHTIFSALLALAYSISVAIYFTLQGKMSANYPCHYSSSFLFSAIGTIQSFLYVICTERSWSQWKLGWDIRLLCAICQGASSVVAIFLSIAAIHMQGPLFVSVFNPLILVFVALAGFLFLDEKLYLGIVLGSIIIIAGLYMVLWGKGKEMKRLSKLTPSGSSKEVNDVLETTNITKTPKTGSMNRTSLSTGDEDIELHINSPRENHKDQDIVEEV